MKNLRNVSELQRIKKEREAAKQFEEEMRLREIAFKQVNHIYPSHIFSATHPLVLPLIYPLSYPPPTHRPPLTPPLTLTLLLLLSLRLWRKTKNAPLSHSLFVVPLSLLPLLLRYCCCSLPGSGRKQRTSRSCHHHRLHAPQNHGTPNRPRNTLSENGGGAVRVVCKVSFGC